MDAIIGILAFIFVLGSIIIVHEAGHFLFARRAGILTREFSFGMGPLIWKKKKGETLYSIRALPIGGFCAIAGEEIEDDPLEGLDTVKVEIKDGLITKIYLKPELIEDDNLVSLEIQSYDIFDADETNNLYIRAYEDGKIVEYKVHPQAFVSDVKHEMQIAPYNRTLGSKTKKERALVMFGGPMMNFLLAFLVFFIAGLLLGFPKDDLTIITDITEGTPSYIAGLRDGDELVSLESGDIFLEINKWSDIGLFKDEYIEKYPSNKIIVTYRRDNEIHSTVLQPAIAINSIGILNDFESDELKILIVGENSKADKAGLKAGMIFTKIDGEIVNSWGDIYKRFLENVDGNKMKLTVIDSQNQEKEIEISPYSKEVIDSQKSFSGGDIPVVDISFYVSPVLRFHLGKSLLFPFTQFKTSVMMVVNTFKLLFKPQTGVGVKDLSGFVGIFSLTKMVALQGFITLLLWLGMLSVNVGILNLLPIPALDGGRLVFLGYEAITGKKPNQKVETALITITFILLLILIIFVTYNDIIKFI